jgi:hypothetical protein
MDAGLLPEGTGRARAHGRPRRLTRLIVTAGLALAAVLSASAGAQAAPVKTVSFSKSWVFKSRPLRVCVYFTLRGRITYTTSFSGRGVVFWENQRLAGPTLEADIHTYGGGSCIGPSTLTRISMGQYWSGYECGFNPSLSVSLPWGISFGGWPSCGSRTRAAHVSSYGGSSFYIQYNGGSPPGSAPMPATPKIGPATA